MQFQSLTISEEDQGKRLDQFMAQALDCSRNQIQNLIEKDHIRINDKTAKKSGLKLKAGDEIAYRIPPESSPHQAEDIPLDILYEDKDMLVINKPAGIVVHPDETGHSSGTLVNAALAHCKSLSDSGEGFRPGVVHRLDKNTSGVIVMAKNNKAHEHLAKLFHDREVEKTYIALVKGHPKSKKGRIDAPIRRDSKHRKQMAVHKQGKPALTTFEVMEQFDGCSLLKVKIETGRTHQIRVHLASIGHPVIGDPVYGNTELNKKFALNRQFLHAAELKISGHHFQAPLPSELTDVIPN